MPVAGSPRSARGSSDRWTLIVAAVASLLIVTVHGLGYRFDG